AAVPAGVVPPVRARGRRACAASHAAGLCVGLPPAGYRDLPARHQLLPAERADGFARPRDVVPPAVPRRRVAAVFARQSERAGRTRPGPRPGLRPRRQAGGQHRAGRTDPRGGRLMRQVFSSPRLENVERVATLLRDEGIEVKVTQRRAYKGGLRGNFTYRDDARTEPMPAVWVVRSEDQPRARAMLRELGLLD